MSELPNRRPCVTEEVGMGLSVTVSYYPQTGQPCEVFLSGRGKASDSPMQEALYNLGVKASLLMQEESLYEKAKSFGEGYQAVAV
jgi:hypothetical protein